MQYWHRNNRYYQRSPLTSSYKNFGWRDGNGFGHQPYHRPNPPSCDPSKEEILKKVGKLAAKYLVSKGLLSPSVLERKHERTGKRFDGDDGGARRVYHRWGFDDGGARTVYHRWGFDDGGDDYKERWQQQGLRDDGIDEDENEPDRGSGEVRWTGKRPWGCYDDWEYDDMEKEGSYQRKRFRKGPRLWCERSKEVRSWDGADEKYRWRAGSSRGQKDFCREEALDVGLKKMEDQDDDTLSYESGEVRDDDDLHWYGGNEGERKNSDELLKLSRAEEMMMDGGGSNGSPSNSREEPATGFTIDLNKAANGGSLESGGDEEMRIIDKFQEKSQDSLDMDISDNMKVKSEMYEELDGAESHCMSNDDDDVILKLCSFPDVPTKPRIALACQGITKINKLFLNELNVVGEIIKIPKANVRRLVMEGLSTYLHKDESNTSRGEDSSVLSIISDKQVEDYVNQQHEVIKSSELLVNVNEETQAVEEPMEEPEIKRVSVDEELVTGHVVGQEKPVRDDSSPKFKPKFKTKVEVGKQPQHTFFKVCDLNFMAPPEENDADDDLVSDHLNACMPVSEASRDHPVGFGCLTGIVPNKTNIQCLLSRGKMIPVIDLVDDSSTESSDHNSPNSDFLLNNAQETGMILGILERHIFLEMGIFMVLTGVVLLQIQSFIKLITWAIHCCLQNHKQEWGSQCRGSVKVGAHLTQLLEGFSGPIITQQPSILGARCPTFTCSDCLVKNLDCGSPSLVPVIKNW